MPDTHDDGLNKDSLDALKEARLHRQVRWAVWAAGLAALGTLLSALFVH